MNPLTKKTIISNINIPIPSRGHQLSDFKDIPTEWDFKKCKDVFSLEYGKGLKESDRNSGDYPVVGSAGIVGTHDKYYIIGKGIVVGRKGSAGLCTYLEKNYWAIDTTYYVEKKQNVDLKWLFFLLNILKLNRLSEGSVPGLNRNDVYQIYIPLPSVEEQQKIAEILSTVDDAIEKTDTIINETQELKKGLMQKLFTEGIGHTRFKETKIGRIPVEWEIKSLGNYIETQKGFAFKSEWYKKSGVPIIRVSDFSLGKIEVDDLMYIDESLSKEFGQYELRQNDIVIQTVGSWAKNPASVVGQSVLIPKMLAGGLLNQNAVRLSVKKGLYPFYLYYLLISPIFMNYIIRQAQGVAQQASITLNSIRKFGLSCPPYEEQKYMANIFMEIEKKIQTEQKIKFEVENLKKGLMQVLLTGKVRVKLS